LALVLCVIAGGTGILMARHTSPPASSIEGLLWPNPRTLGTFSVVDQHGAAFTQDNLRGRWSLLFFGFTHCPDICPVTMSVLAQAKPGLTAAAGDTPLQVIFVSVDPERDGPAQLAEYVRYFDKGFLGLGGTLDQIQALTSQLGVAFFRGPATSTGDYAVDHSAAIFVIDPQVRMVGVLSAPHQADSLVTRFRNMADFLRRAGT
jgi:protein SCO1/2